MPLDLATVKNITETLLNIQRIETHVDFDVCDEHIEILDDLFDSLLEAVSGYKAADLSESPGSPGSQDPSYSSDTVPLNQPGQEANLPAPSAETAGELENAQVVEAGIQPAPTGAVSPLTVDGKVVPLDSEPQEGEDMSHIQKSTDGVGPDITVYDNDDDKHDGKPTPIGALEDQSVNKSETTTPEDSGDLNSDTPTAKGDIGATSESAVEDASVVKPDDVATSPKSDDLKTFAASDEPATRVNPDAEMTETASTSDATSDTFDPSVPSVPPLDQAKEDDKEAEDKPESASAEAEPSASVDDADKEVAPAPLEDDAVESNAAAPSSVDSEEEEEEDSEDSSEEVKPEEEDLKFKAFKI